MATAAEVRGRLRRMLEDTDLTAPLWSDSALNEWLAQATREYGQRRPRAGMLTITPVAGQTAYPLPADVQRVLTVESPAGYRVPPRPARVDPAVGPQSWASFAGVLTFGQPPTAPIVITYRGDYLWPSSDAATVAIPDAGIDLIVLGATIQALSQREIAAGKRRGGVAGVAAALAIVQGLYDRAWQGERVLRSRAG